MSKDNKGTLIALAAMACFATQAIFGKVLLIKFPPGILYLIESCLVTIIFLVFVSVRHDLGKVLQEISEHKIVFIAVAFCSGMVAPLFYFIGLKYTTASNASLLARIEPVAVLVLAILFLQEKISRKQVAGSLFMLAGIFIISTRGDLNNLSLRFADIFLLLSAFSYALGVVISKRFLKKINPETIVFARNAIGFVLSLLVIFLVVIFSGHQFNWNYDPALNDLFLILAVVLITIITAQLLFYKSLSLAKASRVSLVTLTGPIFTIIYAMLFLGETLENYQVFGGAMIVIGLLYLHLHAKEVYRFLRKHEFHYNLRIRRYRK